MVLNAKYRMLYILFGTIGYICLVLYVIVSVPFPDYAVIMSIAGVDMVFFALAYKTYPVNERKLNKKSAYSINQEDFVVENENFLVEA